MKKYKHKKLGWIAESNGTLDDYRYFPDPPYASLIRKELVENSCDWEEIVPDIPLYVKWVDNIGSGGSGWLCDHNNFKYGKIFNTSKDEFPFKVTTWQNALTPAWYPNNFIPATKEEYDLQNRIPLFTKDQQQEIIELIRKYK